jgi:putative ABC transport system ATP-binding protein
MIVLKNVSKEFLLPGRERAADHITVLDRVSFEIADGSWTSLTGASGSGKSTLLSLMSGLDVPTTGEIVIDGVHLSSLSEDTRADFRAQKMGFIFQNFRLLPHLTARENVALPLEILGVKDADQRAEHELALVGMEHRLQNLPGQLSGGEQQRVAIARAFVSRPKILFADEPTGNLDSKNGEIVLELMKKLHQEIKTTLVVVTHDPGVAAHGHRQLRLKDGRLVDG